MSHLFQAGGALLADSTVYVERKADHEALAHLRNMVYLLVIEPRQQGKTSLINHLMSHPALGDAAWAYVDVTTPDRLAETTWYQTLCPRILRQLRSFIPRDQWPTLPQNSAGWRDFLWDVAALATDAQRRVVIALDEIGAVTFPGATEFFSVLRDVYNSRQAESEFKQLTFLLAGAFHPRDLIKDDKISPFNIAQRVRLPDFTMEQVCELVSKGEWAQEQASILAERIHYWTDGQPYLTQLFCSYLEADAAPSDVDASVERLRREDENHLPPLLERLNSDEKLYKYVGRIQMGKHIKFYPRENRRQAQLELLGVIKRGAGDLCVVRNRIYEQVLMGIVRSRMKSISNTVYPLSDVKRIFSLRISADFDEVWRCLAYTRDFERQDDVYWTTQPRLWWSVTEQAHGRTTKSATLLLGINRPGADSIYDFNERQLRLLGGARGWTVIEVYADLVAESQSDPEATKIFNDFLSSFEQMFKRLGHEVLKETGEPTQTKSVVYSMQEPISHPELNDALTHHTLALFIGADLPREVTGLPSRFDLARDLARRKDLDESLSLAEVAQRVSQTGNRWEFTDFIRNALDTTGKPPQPFHRRIVELVKEHQIETLITTAYDNLLELAFQEAGVGINRVVRGSDTAFIRPNRPTLIKLYGDAQQPDTLVVTDRDHSNLLRDRDKEALVDEVRRALRCNTVLFLGYNLSDPDFRFLFDQIAESRFARTAYAVWPGLPETDVQMWRDRGIVILDVDPLGILGESEISLSLPDRREPTVSPPASQPPTGENKMDYKHGLAQLKACLEQRAHQSLAEFNALEERFYKNERDERIFGGSENTRNARSQIIYALNELALEHCGVSFNDLCRGKQLTTDTQQPSDTDEIIERLRRIEGKLDQGRAEDHQDAAQILDAIAQNRVEQAEAAQIVAELRAWAQAVQQTGLPLNPELRTTLDALSEHIGGAYQYLQMAIPIIPGILSYNVELGSQHQANLKAIWGRIKARVGKGSKGDGASTSSESLYGAGNRWAVLVGVNEYQDKAHYGQLHVCVKDVHAIHEKLVAGGFDPARIHLLTDDTSELPTRDNILVALKAIAEATDPDDLLLFYYSGHGDEDEGESYLVARNGRQLVLSDTAVRVSRVKEIMEQAPARAKVIILDACHSGADVGGKGPKQMSEEFIRRVFEQAEGLAILASCKQGQVSYEWRENERSVFTHYLLEGLSGQADRDEKGLVTVQDAHRHVTDGVKLWASQRNRSQTPTLQYAVAGDIILVRYPS